MKDGHAPEQRPAPRPIPAGITRFVVNLFGEVDKVIPSPFFARNNSIRVWINVWRRVGQVIIIKEILVEGHKSDVRTVGNGIENAIDNQILKRTLGYKVRKDATYKIIFIAELLFVYMKQTMTKDVIPVLKA